MKYKAIMLDIDGTLISYNYEALPSTKVIQAIKKAQEKVTVCLVTGRSYTGIKPILQKLAIHTGFAVINNGAHVINIATEEIIYDQPIVDKEAKEIIALFRKDNIEFYLKPDSKFHYTMGPFKKDDVFKKAYMFYTFEKYPEEKIEEILKSLSHLSDLSIYKTRHKDPNIFGLNISHMKATKLHGIEVILKTLNISREEIIGVGDGYNDFSLLMACGLKVAMGNAVQDLKAIADYIAPGVEDDGVADIIKKFVT